jgi:hypothetical protein
MSSLCILICAQICFSPLDRPNHRQLADQCRVRIRCVHNEAQLTSFRSIFMVFSGVFTFLVECYPLYAASALAANSFLRSMFAAGFPLFGTASKSNFQQACRQSFILGGEAYGTKTCSVSQPRLPMGDVCARHDYVATSTFPVSRWIIESLAKLEADANKVHLLPVRKADSRKEPILRRKMNSHF